MTVIENENVRPFDVDGCLVYPTINSSNDVMVDIVDPVTKYFIRYAINKNMVRLLKEEHQRGSYIEVWSRGGWEWARNVVQALKLENYVHTVKTKPVVYFDDTSVENWLKDRVFIGPNEKYKE
jgi:hypothetical protein